MKYFICLCLLFIAIISCGPPVSRIYETPAVYPIHPQMVPDMDSGKMIEANVSVYAPTSTQVKIGAKPFKNFSAAVAYSGNLGGYSGYSTDFDYSFSRNSFDAYAGYVTKIGKHENFYINAGYGFGSTTSIVPEYDNSVLFNYSGKFNRIIINPGFQFNLGKMQRISIGFRQSYVSFKEYSIPGTRYSNKRQSLSDAMLDYTFGIKRFRGSFFGGYFFNGHKSGYRNDDGKYDKWRIEKVYIGMRVGYIFRLKEKQ
jgi:hypothetical protein